MGKIKTHFRQAHQEVKEAGDLQVGETQFNLANLVQEVIDGVQSVLTPPDNVINQTEDVIQHMANSAAQQQLMPQMMAQMLELLEKMTAMQQNLQNQSTATSTV